jgi:hypothetical protein
MYKSKSNRARTRLGEISATGPRLLDEQQLRLASGGLRNDGTCLPGQTYPKSFTNPDEPDTCTDDVFD